jgi:hypothetical protein
MRNAVNHKKLWHLCAILFSSLVVMAPILIVPHWGLYSDAEQILTKPEEVVAAFTSPLTELLPNLNAEIGPRKDGRWTPTFQLLNTAIYSFFGENPRAFYAVSWAALATVLIVTFSLTYVITEHSYRAAWFAVALLLLGAPIFENFYTLDKPEVWLGLFSLLSLGWFAWSLRKHWRFPPSPSQLISITLGQFVLAIGVISTKETGVFLLPVAAVMVAVLWLQTPRSSGRVTQTIILFAAYLTAFILFRLLFRLLMDPREMNYRYTTYEITLPLIINNLAFYLSQMPEVVFACILFMIWGIQQLIRGRIRYWVWQDIVLVGLGSAGCTYFGGMLLWRWPLVYFLYPATIFLSMTTAVLTHRLMSPDIYRRVRLLYKVCIAFVLLVAAGFYIEKRFYDGFAIYAQDQAKDVLVAALLPEINDETRLVMAFTDPNAFELGERLEFFLNRTRPEAVKMFNLFEGPWIDRGNLNRYEASFAAVPDRQSLYASSQKPAPVAWKFDGCTWSYSELTVGDWFVVPVGSERNKSVSARGISLYAQTATTYLAFAPQLKFKERLQVRVPVGFWGREYLGWDVLEYEGFDIIRGAPTRKASRSSANIVLGNHWYPFEKFDGETFRWVDNNAELIVKLPSDVTNDASALQIEVAPGPGIDSQPFTLYLQNEAGQTIAQKDIRSRQTISLNLPQLRSEKSFLFRLHIEARGHPIPSDERLLNFRVFSLRWNARATFDQRARS